MINFKLTELDKITPWGEEPELSLHWFGLSHGDLWLSLGNETIYEYSKEAMDYWGNKSTPYNKATYDLLLAVFNFTKDFSREYKYTVGESQKNKELRWVTVNST